MGPSPESGHHGVMWLFSWEGPCCMSGENLALLPSMESCEELLRNLSQALCYLCVLDQRHIHPIQSMQQPDWTKEEKEENNKN